MAGADCISVLRGLQKFSRAAFSLHQQNAQNCWNSSYCAHQLLSGRGCVASASSPHVKDGPGPENGVPPTVNSQQEGSTSPANSSADNCQAQHASGAAERMDKTPLSVSQNESCRHSSASSTSSTEGSGEVRQEDQAAPAALSSRARQRRVPASRISRLMTFSGLAAGLGVGAVSEFSKRAVGLSEGSAQSSMFLTESNINRLVATLCRVRGAALKLGQMISIQDGQFISPQIQKIFERVRDGADYMPLKQTQKAITSELGPTWRDRLETFEELPFAAASIGQVHRAVLKDGREVVMKVQYPGVADSIDSDIDNIMTLMNTTNILPEGLFAENALRVAKKELAWEVDYEREAECGARFRKLLADNSYFVIPEVITDLSSKRVLTMELLNGTALDRYDNLGQAERNKIGHHMLELCMREVFEFRFMQTDPNWSNFFYLPKEHKVGLLDFGASRDFPKSFTDDYLRVIHSAACGDRQAVLDGSIKMGFLTGFESEVMMKAHTDAVMVLGEPFAYSAPFNFGGQNVTERIRRLMPVMLDHRLTPPPEETYSLHRKLSGAFLLCAKLNSSISCKPILEKIVANYQYD